MIVKHEIMHYFQNVNTEVIWPRIFWYFNFKSLCTRYIITDANTLPVIQLLWQYCQVADFFDS